MCRINDNGIHVHTGQRTCPFHSIPRHANSRTHSKPAILIFTRFRIIFIFLYILHGDQPGQITILINHQQFFNAMLLENIFRFFKRCPHRNRHQVFRCHSFRDLEQVVGFKPDIPVGNNAHKTIILYHRQSADLEFGHDFLCILNRRRYIHRYRIQDHAAFRPFDPIHHVGLVLNSQILMNDPHPSGSCQGNGHIAFSHRVHGRTQDGNIEPNIFCKACFQVNVPGQHS